MMKYVQKFLKSRRAGLSIFLLLFVLIFGTVFTGCGEEKEQTGQQQEELSEEDILALEDMEEEVLDEEDIQEAFEDELVPLDEQEAAMLDDAEGDPALEDDSMTSLDEEDLEDPEGGEEEWIDEEEDVSGGESFVDEDGTYTSKDEVAAYLHTYGHLPANYITKSEAQKLGWKSSEGNLDEVAPGMSIGGDRFGNYEGMLPEEDGRTYRECDIDFDGGYRNEKRIIYSNDGLIFYTGDHYETFEQLY